MKEKLKSALAACKRGIRKATSAIGALWQRAAVPTGHLLARVWNAVYLYHYHLGVFVLRKVRRITRAASRVTYKPRRRLRYVWVITVYRPIHRFFRRMWRLMAGLPHTFIHLWRTMKKNTGNILLFLPRVVWRWMRNYREEWFTLGRFLGPVVGIVFLFSTVRTWSQTRFCLLLTYRGTELGVIESASVYDEGASMARARVADEDNTFTVDAVPKLTMVVRGAKSTMTATEVCEAILAQSYNPKDHPQGDGNQDGVGIVEAFGLYIDGDFMGAVEDEEALAAMLENIKNSSLKDKHDGSTNKNPDENNLTIVDERIEFVQTVRVEKALYPATTLKDVEAIRQRLTTQEVTEDTYTVQAGDTFGAIAAANDMTVTQLQQLNNLENINALQIGQVLTVQRPQYFLQVKVVRTERQDNVVVEYKTRTTYRDDKYTDWSNEKTKGKNGTKSVVSEITYLDGYEIERIVVEEIVTVEPVTRVVEVGTKKRPSSGGSGSVQGNGIYTGKWTWPVPVCHNVYQGYHGGHKAWDISSGPVPVFNTPCLAVDGGTVIYAGWYYGYGYYIKIDHGNGIVTTYAHLNSIAVRKGQKVTNGQEIGRVGNTGNSTGPHLHFEVYKNGVKVNPGNYINP